MNEFHLKNTGFHKVERQYIKIWLSWVKGRKRRKPKKYLEKVKAIIELYHKEPTLDQAQISRITGIPKSTVNRIVKELVRIGALRVVVTNVANLNKYQYCVNQEFLEFINTYIVATSEISSYSNKKGRSFPDSSKCELYKEGWFRIHGFQRKWILCNYKLIEDDEKWDKFAHLIDDKQAQIEKVRIGRKGKGVAYLVKVFSRKFRTHFLLQFRSNSLIISLPRGGSIYIHWNEFNENVENELVEEIRYWALRAIEVYREVFNQQVFAYDDGWVGKKNPLKPKVAYIDPSGTIRKVYDVAGAVYIEGLGYWIDGSLSPTNPELEFDTIEEASKFKKAIEILASGELDAKIESLERKIEEELKELKHLSNILKYLITINNNILSGSSHIVYVFGLKIAT